jgi:DUF4097 and DUF4098 domain-containing protein YvlB
MRTVLFLASVLLTHAAVAERIERQAEAAADGEVEIVNVSGEVRVIGWDQAKVQLQADVGRGVEEVQFDSDSDGDVTRIRVKWPNDKQAGATNLTVHVPRQSTLMVKTVSASQTIENVQGEQRLQSVSGAINTSMGSEDLEAKTVSGQVLVRGNGKPASSRITSVSGEIRMEDVAGDLELSTVNGAIDVRATQIEEARLNTTNGEIRVQTGLNEDARIEAEAINGTIQVNLRGKIDAQFEIESFNGGIQNCFGPKPRRTSEYAPGTVLRFAEGEGEARVRIKTLNGAIELCNKG